MTKKPKILLCWWYDRKDLIEPFLSMQNEVEFVVLFYRFKEQEVSGLDLPFERIYWTDFPSPYKLLDFVRPEKVVMMGIENMLTISLNIAAQNKKIPTYYLAHGITYSLQDAISSTDPQLQTIERYKINNPIYHKRKQHSFQFFLSSIKLSNLGVIPFLLRFMLVSARQQNIHLRLVKCISKYRQANKYILFAPAYSRFFKERDGVSEEQFEYVGPYPMDKLFQSLGNGMEINESDYWLFIDQPISFLTWQQRKSLFCRIAHEANQIGKKLIVKLHPMNYEQKDLPNINGLEFEKGNVDLNILITKAGLCIGFYSALLLPIIAFKNVLILDDGNTSIASAWNETGALYRADVFRIMNESKFWPDLYFDKINKTLFRQNFIKHTDGESTQRLKNILKFF